MNYDNLRKVWMLGACLSAVLAGCDNVTSDPTDDSPGFRGPPNLEGTVGVVTSESQAKQLRIRAGHWRGAPDAYVQRGIVCLLFRSSQHQAH
jgi:hypothetical protein